MTKESIATQLERARNIFSIASSDPDLVEALTPLGYDPPTITQGRALYDAAVAARSGTHAAHGNQLGATNNLADIRQRVDDQVSALAQTARAVFRDDPDTLETLGLRLGLRATPETAEPNDPDAPAEGGTPLPPGQALPGKRRRSESQAALLDRARVLYDNAQNDPAIRAALQQVGYTPARLAQERADVTTLETLDTTQEARKADAKARTADQDEALDALNDWVSRFRGIVKAGLRDRPDLLDKLGL